MSSIRFRIGADASCTDGTAGEVRRVVVDPRVWAVIDLVVEPKHREGLGRLVPIDLVELLRVTDDEIPIHCTLGEFEMLGLAEETDFLPLEGGQGGDDAGHLLYRLEVSENLPPVMSTGGVGVTEPPGMGIGNIPEPVTHMLVPEGELEVARGDSLEATDGAIGRVQGILMDSGTRRMTHVILQEGHLWNSKEVAIPVTETTAVGDSIHLNIKRQEVRDLPPVESREPGP